MNGYFSKRHLNYVYCCMAARYAEATELSTFTFTYSYMLVYMHIFLSIADHPYNYISPQELVQKAIDNSLSVRESWERVPMADKIAIFHKAADMMATKYRQDLNATTMLGQVGA